MNHLFIIAGSASENKCVCGEGKKSRDPESRDPESFVHKKRNIFCRSTSCVSEKMPIDRPWVTFIQIKKEGSKFHCGGSIINNYWILSAGHCFCEQLKCKPSRGGNGYLKIAYKPSDHILIITGLEDIYHIISKGYTPKRIFIHPL